jgi:hypothetical protein
MTCTLLASLQVRHTYAFYGQSTYVVTFHVNSTESDKFTAPEKKMLPTPPLSPVEWPVGPTSVSLSTQSFKQYA